MKSIRIENCKYVYTEEETGLLKLPKNISGPRSNNYILLSSCISIAILLTSAYYMPLEWIITYSLFRVIEIVASTLIERLVLCIEEYAYLQSRYDNSLKKLILCAFEMNLASTITYIISIALVVFWPFTVMRFGDSSCAQVSTGVAILLLTPLLKMHDSPLSLSRSISNMNGLDVGTHMANAFFHGYLKILLPPDGMNMSGLDNLMEIYEAKNRIKFAKRCLFVLIPLSLHCPPNLSKASKKMEEAGSLKDIEVNRAGVKNRNYKNSVYKIKPDYPNGDATRVFYVCAEYATPVKTLQEVINSDNNHSAIYKLLKKDILWQFYTTLETLIATHSDLKGLCVPIYFDDVKSNGQNVDVGDLLLKYVHSSIQNSKI